MNRFAGRVALVSGGTGGLGTAIGKRLADEGCLVVLADVNIEKAEAVRAQFTNAVLPEIILLDVTSVDSWQKALAHAESLTGQVDVVVNNAGVVSPEPVLFEDCTVEEWSRIFKINVDGVFLGTREAIRKMRHKGGAIVNIGSVAAYTGSRDYGAYGISKAAVRSLSKHAALSAARAGHKIRVNTVHPGNVWTPLIAEKSIRQFGSEAAARQSLTQLSPAGRLVQSSDVAAAVAFLASSDAEMINGADLVIDGGRLLQ